MTNAVQHKNRALPGAVEVVATNQTAWGGAGILHRIAAVFDGSRQRYIDREAADFVARSGGRLTDGLEREMTAHLMGLN